MESKLGRAPDLLWRMVFCVCSFGVLGSGQAWAQEAEESSTASVDAAELDEDARLHFQLGSRLYSRGEFTEAAAEFERAYEASHRPRLLYNMYIAHRDAGDVVQAASALRAYLNESPEDDLQEVRRILDQRLHTLERQAAAEAGTSEEPAAEPDLGTEPAGSEADDSAPPLDPVGEAENGGGVPVGPIVTIAAGGAAILAGVVTGVVVSGQQAELDTHCPNGRCRSEYWDDVDSAQELALITDVLLIGGGTLVAVGVVWWLLSGDDDPDAAVQGACTSDGCSVLYGGRF